MASKVGGHEKRGHSVRHSIYIDLTDRDGSGSGREKSMGCADRGRV